MDVRRVPRAHQLQDGLPATSQNVRVEEASERHTVTLRYKGQFASLLQRDMPQNVLHRRVAVVLLLLCVGCVFSCMRVVLFVYPFGILGALSSGTHGGVVLGLCRTAQLSGVVFARKLKSSGEGHDSCKCATRHTCRSMRKGCLVRNACGSLWFGMCILYIYIWFQHMCMEKARRNYCNRSRRLQGVAAYKKPTLTRRTVANRSIKKRRQVSRTVFGNSACLRASAPVAPVARWSPSPDTLHQYSQKHVS